VLRPEKESTLRADALFDDSHATPIAPIISSSPNGKVVMGLAGGECGYGSASPATLVKVLNPKKLQIAALKSQIVAIRPAQFQAASNIPANSLSS
jgi:hypothetical protein